MKYHVWMEGYRATGDSSEAQCQGEWEGETFLAACENWAKSTGRLGPGGYDSTRNAYWGCQLFDNEADARKSFG